jgi:hypothetical protein
MSRKATHRGHCQACGRLQMLPHGDLSLHGYTVDHGFFSGVCRGARHLPFEESCALVETFIREALDSIVHLEERQRELREPVNGDPICWIRNYEEYAGRPYCNHYVWRRVQLIDERGPHGCSKSYMAPGSYYDNLHSKDSSSNAVRHGFSDNSYGQKTLQELATDENVAYAERVIGAQITQLQRYITWQRKRVAEWKPQPLFPLTHKDKEGFDVTEQQ